MSFCRNCGKQMDDSFAVCPYCGTRAGESAPSAQNYVPDEVSVGFCIVSFLVPLFGWIYWACVASKTPKRGRACGIAAFVSFGLDIVLGIILTIVYTVFFAAMIGGALFY